MRSLALQRVLTVQIFAITPRPLGSDSSIHYHEGIIEIRKQLAQLLARPSKVAIDRRLSHSPHAEAAGTWVDLGIQSTPQYLPVVTTVRRRMRKYVLIIPGSPCRRDSLNLNKFQAKTWRKRRHGHRRALPKPPVARPVLRAPSRSAGGKSHGRPRRAAIKAECAVPFRKLFKFELDVECAKSRSRFSSLTIQGLPVVP